MKRTANRSCLIVASFILASMLASCGFHPRGSVTRLTDLGSIYVDASRDLSIAASVEEALIDAAFELARNRDEADILLRLTDEKQAERVVSVNSTGRVSELELSHTVNMLIAESVDGDAPVYPENQNFNRVEVTREYTYDQTGVLGKENEARILRAEMKEELVRQIILRTIASLAPSVSALSVDNPVR
ncbi:LPS assembly lipoprotein LptE [Granulosicoccus antarcticus]|nr:LPS assembly lipoprotein LptE [Granulosicoccus antarcticus]